MSDFLIQVFLPLADNDGKPFSKDRFEAEKATLTGKFGGVTVYARAPAKGLWAKGDEIVTDEMIIFEVITGEVDVQWWRRYRTRLEHAFRQDNILVRASTVTLL